MCRLSRVAPEEFSIVHFEMDFVGESRAIHGLNPRRFANG
jgi:hypothetical protein